MNWKQSGQPIEVVPRPLPALRVASRRAAGEAESGYTAIASSMTSRRGREGQALIDGCGRHVDRLRLSVTPACDLRCVYCRPSRELIEADRTGYLDDRQRVEFVRFLHEWYGLKQLRITGGEPLVYRGVVSLVAAARNISENLSLAMTTHGAGLVRDGLALRQAGLERLNVSLDSLSRERYQRMTGGDLDEVLDGLKAAEAAGFPPPKINTVVLRGMNDDELIDLVYWAMDRGSEIRFLEAMPIGPAAETNRRAFVSAAEIKSILAGRFALDPISGHAGDTASCFRASDGRESGVVGLISPVTQPFCGGCRRIRLTATGQVYPCLLDNRHVDMMPAWRGGQLDRIEADRLIQSAVAGKKPRGTRQSAPMVSLGG